MKETINILFSTNSGYAIPLTVSIASIFENNKEYKVDIYVLYSTLSDNQKEKLNELAKSYNQNINIIQVEDYYFNNVPALRWSKETYYRLLINELLPSDLNRILYLDCDIVINKSIEDLYNLDLEENCIAALIEDNDLKPRQRLGLSPDGDYFQAGVILFDIDKCKSRLSYEKSIEILNKIGDRLLAVDQDVINVMFDGKIKSIEEKFNNCKITNFYGNNINRLFNHINKDRLDNTVVFHYSTGKPWNNLFSGSAEKIWYQYLKLSPYRDLYNKKYNTLKYKIFRLGIMKFMFYVYIHITPFIEKTARKILSVDRYNNLKNFYRRNIK